MATKRPTEEDIAKIDLSPMEEAILRHAFKLDLTNDQKKLFQKYKTDPPILQKRAFLKAFSKIPIQL